MFYIFSAIWLLFSGCRKEPMPVPEPPIPNPSKLEIVWQKPVSSDTSEHYVNVHDASNNKVLYCVNLSSPTATLQTRNADNGQLDWVFSNFLSPSSGFFLVRDLFTYGSKIMVQDDTDVYCIDYLTGERLWVYEALNAPLGCNKIGENLYTEQSTGNYPYITSSSIVRTKASNQFTGWDTVYTRLAVPDTFPLFNIPVVWVNNNGDSIIVFNDVHGYNGPPPTAGRGKTYLTALNLRTRQVAWQYPNFEGYYLAPPLVDGDRLYINGPDVFCFDLHTGNLLWQKAFEGGVGGTSLVVHNDILVVQSTQIGMWGVNKYTGDGIWHNKDTDGTTWELLLFDGVVYSTSSGYGRLYAVNAETGATIWKEQSPNRKNPKTGNASFANAGVAIDPERRLLYTADKYYVMCIKLPEK